MARDSSIRAELDRMRSELDSLRKAQADLQPAEAQKDDEAASPAGIEEQLRRLLAQSETVLEEAGNTIASHPLSSIAGALALGIVIGRFTAR